MIKPTKTKAEVRAELEAQIQRFISTGGDVKAVDSGISGIDNNRNVFAQNTSFTPKETRTPLNGIVRELDARKKATRDRKSVKKKPSRRLIVDDFGEPVRWVWDE